MASKVELDPKTGGIKGDTSEEVYQLEQVEFSEDESDDGFEYTEIPAGEEEDDIDGLANVLKADDDLLDDEPTAREEDLETARLEGDAPTFKAPANWDPSL